MKDWQPTPIRGAIPVGGRLFVWQAGRSCSDPEVRVGLGHWPTYPRPTNWLPNDAKRPLIEGRSARMDSPRLAGGTGSG